MICRCIVRAAVVATVVGAVLGGVSLINGASEARPGLPAPHPVSTAYVGATGAAAIPALERAARDAPQNVDRLVALADAHLQAVRETGDFSHYLRADGVLHRAARVRPGDSGVQIGLANLALARHDFGAGLLRGRAARAAAPQTVRPYAVLVDALVELGRYQAAGRALQRMIDLRPNLASYARVSYFRELHGDLRGAVKAMRLAVSAGGGTAEGTAYVQTLLGGLEFGRGRLGRARRAYALALRSFPRYLAAEVGLARLDGARGRFPAAISRMRRVVVRLPLPEYVITLGELELAAGRRPAAKEDFALVDAERRLLAANGVNTDVEVALFEADHGDARRGVALGRRAWRGAPSVRSADALSWALTRAGRPRDGLRFARRAVRLGSRDPLLLTHAGLTAKLSGAPAPARRYLSRALADNPRFSPLWAPRARRALRAIS